MGVANNEIAPALRKSLFKLRCVSDADIPCPALPTWGSKRFISKLIYEANCLIGNK